MLTLLKDARAIALLLAASLTILSNSLISPALPGIEARFAGEDNAALLARLLVTAPSLMVAILAPFAGAMADRFGRRPQLIAGVALFAIAGTAGLYLPTLHLILASRLMLGVSVALIMTAQTALIGDYFHGAARGKFMGLQIAATNFGGLIFLVLAGWLAAASPLGPFAIYGIAAVYLPVMLLALRRPQDAGPGAHAAATDGEAGWIATLALVVLLAGLCFVCFYLLPTQAPYFLATLGHPEPQAAGLLMGAMTLAGGVMSLFFSPVRLRLGRAGTPALGFLFFAAGFLLFSAAGSFGPALLGGAFRPRRRWSRGPAGGRHAARPRSRAAGSPPRDRARASRRAFPAAPGRGRAGRPASPPPATAPAAAEAWPPAACRSGGRTWRGPWISPRTGPGPAGRSTERPSRCSPSATGPCPT